MRVLRINGAHFAASPLTSYSQRAPRPHLGDASGNDVRASSSSGRSEIARQSEERSVNPMNHERSI
jgi:hypothetical protein